VKARAAGFALAAALAALPAGAASPVAGEEKSGETAVVSSSRLPLVAEGGTVTKLKDRDEREGQGFLERRFRLDAPGIWYIWLLVTSDKEETTLLTWELDGNQPLRSSRSEILVPPNTTRQWVSYTRYRFAPGFKAQVNVDKPGVYTLRIVVEHGNVEIHKVALTLHYGAVPKGDTLDHSDDPGMGRASFPAGDLAVDGFRQDYRTPAVAASRTFYLDNAAGNDAANGRTPATAWRTVDRANAADWRPGDALLLKRGGKFRGGLQPRGDGTVARPITVGAFGEGPCPLIDGMDRPAIRLVHQSWWTIQDITATSDAEKRTDGIEVMATSEKPQPRGIRILNCVAFDNGGDGIHVGGGGDNDNGYDGVLIENCLSFWNGGDGIQVNGVDQNGCRNSVVRFCTAYGNPGMAGIWVHSGQNGLIEQCRSYNNACINIWTWNAINVTIRRCEAFRGRPPRDAGGFDIDWGCEGCTVEYCYSHHNMGVGFLLMGHGVLDYRGFPQKSEYNVMRYCVSEGDHPGIGLTETFNFGYVFNNTVVAVGKNTTALDCGGWPLEPWEGGGYSGGWPADTAFLNNILVGMDGALPLWVDDFATRQRNVFDHNLLFRIRSKVPLVKWAGRRAGPGFWEGTNRGNLPPETYADMASFRKYTKQEKNGMEADPLLAAAGSGGCGRLPLAAYLPGKGSPVHGAGERVVLPKEWHAARMKYLTETGATVWGIPMAPADAAEDYWGNKLEGDSAPIGAAK